MGDFDTTATLGIEARGYRRGTTGTDSWDQYVVPVEDKIISYQGRANTFRIPGRAGATGQKLMSLHNATGSTILVSVDQVRLDMAATVVKAVTVLPPIIRLHKVTVLPTNGSTLAKVGMDSSQTSSSSVTLLQDASADGTLSGTALTATLPAGSIITQEYTPRLITAAGYEMYDRTEYLSSNAVTLRALEGIVLFLDYSVATQNVATDMWIAGISWREYTRP